MYKFKAKFQLSNEFISSESEEIQKTMQLSEPIIQIITPTNNYHINDVIPITITITNRKGQPIPNLGFTLTINGTSYSCTTNSEGIYTFDYTILTDDDLEVTITTNITSVYDTVTVEETIAIDSREYTNLSIVSSTSSTIFLNSFTLTATLNDANGNLINGAVKFYEGSTLLGTVNTTNGVAQYTVSNASITSHTYHAVFEQTTDYHEATSSNVTVNVTKDTPKLSKLTGDLYSGWVTACQLTNSKGTALSSKTVSIKISTNNSTWSTYNKTTNSSGKASQTITGGAQKIYVQYVFAGDSQYNAVTLTGTFNILSPKSVKKAAGTIVSNPASDSGSYRKWYDTYTDGDDNPIRAGNTCNSAPIAGKNGTHNRPAAIVKSGWGFNIPTGATITKIVCAWKSKQGECGNAYPSIPAGTVTLKVGSLTLTGTGSKGGNGSYVSSSKTWSSPNVSAANVNSSGMKLTLSHAANTNSNPGLFYVIGPTLTVYYNPAQGSV